MAISAATLSFLCLHPQQHPSDLIRLMFNIFGSVTASILLSHAVLLVETKPERTARVSDAEQALKEIQADIYFHHVGA